MVNGKTIGSLLYWDGIQWVPTERTAIYYDVANDKLVIDGNLTLSDLSILGDLEIVKSVATSGYAKIANKDSSFVGATVPAIVSETDYELDITVDGTLRKLKTIDIDITDDWSAVVAAIQVSLRSATSSTEIVTIVGGKIVVTSITTGASSTVLIAAGTDGTGSGDLLAIIDLIANYTTILETPYAGIAAVGGDLAVGGNLSVSGTINATGLPTSDPTLDGALWTDTLVVTLSTGTP